MSGPGSNTQTIQSPPEVDATRCSHIRAILADAAAKDAILSKYKAAVAWNVHRMHALKQSVTPARFKVNVWQALLGCEF